MMSSKQPIHEQIRIYIAEKIDSGEWKPGTKIPSEREISEQFQISRVTVRQALNNLANEGRIKRIQGQGTFVTIPKVEMLQGELISITTLMEKQGKKPETIVLKLEKEPLYPATAVQIGYPIGTEMFVIQRIRKDNEITIVLENSLLPCHLFPGFDQYDLAKNSIFSLMAEKYKLSNLLVHQTIEASTAPDEIAEKLGIKSHSSIVAVKRIVRDENNNVVEYAKDYYPANRIRFVYEGIINIQESQKKFKKFTAPIILES